MCWNAYGTAPIGGGKHIASIQEHLHHTAYNYGTCAFLIWTQSTQVVLVVGASNSGEDISREASAGGAARVLLSARSWKNEAWGADAAPYGPGGNIYRLVRPRATCTWCHVPRLSPVHVHALLKGLGHGAGRADRQNDYDVGTGASLTVNVLGVMVEWQSSKRKLSVWEEGLHLVTVCTLRGRRAGGRCPQARRVV